MKKEFRCAAVLCCFLLILTACGGKDDGGGKLPIKPPEPPVVEEDILPTPLAQENYSPSLNGKPYKPILIKYSSAVPVTSWKEEKTRILPYMVGFEADDSRTNYLAKTNRYGSRKDKGQQAATGRFYTKKIDGRWWLVDPEGYLHYERSVASFRKGSSSRNKTAWAEKYGTDQQWVSSSQEELAVLGFHGTGAFCTNAYNLIQDHNRSNPGMPLTLAPSFGFLSAFRSKYSLNYPGGASENACGLAFDERWESFCEEYIRTNLAAYLNDPNVLGFFSDNEINFSSASSMVLDRFLKINSENDLAYQKAKKFMQDKGATTVTSALNSEFAGIVAEAYYKGVKQALMKVDPQMLYLGSRLHGTPKYQEHVIRAAGRWCDVISINYYARWSVELTTSVNQWAQWADAPFLVTEFYTKAMDSGLPNTSGAGFAVPTEKDKAYAYQHFTLGLLEAKNCVGWHWFKYQDDDGTDNDSKPANKGAFDNYYKVYPYLGKYMKTLNYNAYDLIDYFDKP